MQISVCRSHAISPRPTLTQASQYFGAELGNQCFCGNAIGTFPPPIPVLDSLCVLPCVGNTLAGKPLFDQICGGPTQISIYQKNAGTIPPIPANPTYFPLGCYSQASNGVPLTDTGLTIPSGFTIQMCEALCQGFDFYGVTAGSTCICGNQIGAGAYIQDPSACNIACNGNSGQQCGSSLNVNLYAKSTSTECAKLGTDLRIRNPGFENGNAFWTSSTVNPADIQWQSINYPEALTGSRVARIASRSLLAVLTLSQESQICAYTGYILSFAVREDLDSSCTVRLQWAGTTQVTADATTTWVTHRVYVTSPTTNNLVALLVQCDGTKTINKVYIDNVQLRPAQAADSALFPV